MTPLFINKPFTGRLKQHCLISSTINYRKYDVLILQAGKLFPVIIHRHTDSYQPSALNQHPDTKPMRQSHAMCPIVCRLPNLTDHHF